MDNIENIENTENVAPPPSSNDNLEFVAKKVKFSAEDEEKMKSMTLEERIAYKRKLKAEQRYVYEE
ncbi:hypothetical protein IJ472_05505 [bacterium]|nr:hypothetical protein [bacterium]